MAYVCLEFLLPSDCVEEAAQPGDNLPAVRVWIDDPRIAGQLAALTEKEAFILAAAHGRNDYKGTPDDHQGDLEFILWSAAHNVQDELHTLEQHGPEEGDPRFKDGDRFPNGYPGHRPEYADDILLWATLEGMMDDCDLPGNLKGEAVA